GGGDARLVAVALAVHALERLAPVLHLAPLCAELLLELRGALLLAGERAVKFGGAAAQLARGGLEFGGARAGGAGAVAGRFQRGGEFHALGEQAAQFRLAL